MIQHHSPIAIRIALVYPNYYPVGMANLGLQTVYRLFNSLPATACERAFLQPFNSIQRLTSVESNRQLTKFDLIAFSVSFETDYVNIINIIEDSGFILETQDRPNHHPFIIAGGAACMLNPEPISPFMDCILIGEGEVIIPTFMNAFVQSQSISSRRERLAVLGQNVSGCYVPSLYHTDNSHRQKIPDDPRLPETIQRVYLQNIQTAPAVTTVIAPNTAFGKTYLVEVSRGCPYGCRFCAAGFIYRPPRFHNANSLIQLIKHHARHTDRIGLVGTAFSDIADMNSMCEQLNSFGFNISFSSLRADSITPQLAKIMADNHIKTATYAPEAGSQRLRQVINKGITEQDILYACEHLISTGILNLKLYFMIGLPSETQDDIQAIIELCLRIKASFLNASRRQKRIGNIIVSLNPFIPKPWTPFQRCPIEPPDRLNQKINQIRSGLKAVPNIKIQAESPKQAFIQTLLSQGGDNISQLLKLVRQNHGNWPKSLKEFPQNLNDIVFTSKNQNQAFPWEIINAGISKDFLNQEYHRSQQNLPSPPCRMAADCHWCGVC